MGSPFAFVISCLLSFAVLYKHILSRISAFQVLVFHDMMNFNYLYQTSEPTPSAWDKGLVVVVVSIKQVV